MEIDTYALRAFVEIADSGSFSRAAETLHLSQPAISKRIASLEAQLRQPLFDRLARQVSLTDAGRTLLPHARRALQELQDGARALTRLDGPIAGRLSIGTSHHIGLHRLPPLLRSYVQRHPQVDLDIQFMDSELACQAVLAGKLELGIVTLPLSPLPQLESRIVWPDPLAVVVSSDHPLAQPAAQHIQQLAGYPAVLPDAATYTHRIVTAALQKHGLSPRVRLATNYLETLKMLVSIGLGWSVLPRSMLDDPALTVLDIPELRLSRNLGAVWHTRRTLSAAASALLRELPEPSE